MKSGLSQEGKVEIRFLGELHQQMSFLAPDDNWDVTRLADWLDRTVKHLDIYGVSLCLFCSGWSSIL